MDVDQKADSVHKDAMAKIRRDQKERGEKYPRLAIRTNDAFEARLDDLRADERPLLSRGAFIKKLVKEHHTAKFPKRAREIEAMERAEDDED